MKHFIVYLRDGREVHVRADTYGLEDEQYVFDTKGRSEAQFFQESVVAGITEAAPCADQSIPHPPRTP